MQCSRAVPQSHKIDETSSEHFNWRAGLQEPADEPNATINTPDASVGVLTPPHE